MAKTGRTTPLFQKLQIEDVTGVLRDIPVLTFGDVGINYDEFDVSALQDLIKSFMMGLGTFALTISGPFDTTTPVAASTSGQASGAHLSGSHAVLEPLNGGGTPRALGIYFGIQEDWTAGGTEPVFGADNCVIVTGYTVNDGKYTCKLAHAGGGTIPAWGTTAIAVV